ncbi:uncharacterized protein LOC132606984 isoform X1 [Lycium barbarum]|uniref:uncharacterized protein LOC132606984 isoform X1 n=1 Tax=Lycium barbarum TaxID=112863 RepID=UPI00293EDE77|nr:uncharacterized protein LOC132606984 isoform X1 [Lycium barbarum]XP_060176747.1 uncharacterized protein LOC132606984 isoform X1 [Lycium barbarum]XP_060176748.1 uncharacterized protein LOC132606984 isoform X1 [Lycium barbarum]
MGAGRRTQTFVPDSASSFQTKHSGGFRYLTKKQLGGVIFGCKDNTMKECILKQLFGLPAPHYSYVKNIDPGLPLFLFNYSNRELHGIFEAASSGEMHINPYAWTSDGSGRTLFPAQVQIRVRMQCRPLPENLFKPIILDNYYKENHFLFELDHVQAGKLISKLSSRAFVPTSCMPQNAAKWKTIIQGLPAIGNREENGCAEPEDWKEKFTNSLDLNGDFGEGDIFLCSSVGNQKLEAPLDNQAELDDKDLIYTEFRELATRHDECSGASINGHEEESTIALMTATINDVKIGEETLQEAQIPREEKNEESSSNLAVYPAIIAQLLQGIEELKASREEQTHKMCSLEQKLADAEEEIKQLKYRYMMPESSNPSFQLADETVFESVDQVELDPESIFLVGGYDGVSWLSTLESYSLSNDVQKSLKPMSSVRSYASVAKLCGELYVFGGGTGSLWYDTVESYSPADNEWTRRPSLNKKKGTLAGATLKDKIFAIGGGNGVDCFSEVEMYDPEVGRWITTRSMWQKRFSLAAAELNGALYAVGGYDGSNYLATAERFDPREHSWTKIKSMSTSRGCHALAALDGKLYAVGGYDGSTMVPSTEIYDPRVATWMVGEPMKHSRGYSAAVVLQESIYVIGGVQSGEEITDVIECYKEGQGWQTPNLKGIGKRCFCSAIVLSEDCFRSTEAASS